MAQVAKLCKYFIIQYFADVQTTRWQTLASAYATPAEKVQYS